MIQLLDKTLQIARTQIGVVEGPKHDNTGKEVNEYLKRVGLGPGFPWCASFVYWCADEAANQLGIANPLLRTAACAAMSSWAYQHDILRHDPTPGCIFLRYETVDGIFRAGHTGLVETTQGNAFTTIEGNTNLDGSRDGYGVFRRQHTVTASFKFVDWGVLCAPSGVETYKLYLRQTFIVNMPVVGGRSMCPLTDWAQMLGFQLNWDQERQVATFDGQVLHSEVVIYNGAPHAPLRQLVEAAGLTMTVDVPNLTVTVTPKS